MPSALTLSRISAFLGAVGSALVIFVANVAPAGKYTAGGIMAGLIAVWLHEEHSTERTSTTAAASITRPSADQSHLEHDVAELQGILNQIAPLLGGVMGASPPPPAAAQAAPGTATVAPVAQTAPVAPGIVSPQA